MHLVSRKGLFLKFQSQNLPFPPLPFLPLPFIPFLSLSATTAYNYIACIVILFSPTSFCKHLAAALGILLSFRNETFTLTKNTAPQRQMTYISHNGKHTYVGNQYHRSSCKLREERSSCFRDRIAILLSHVVC